MEQHVPYAMGPHVHTSLLACSTKDWQAWIGHHGAVSTKGEIMGSIPFVFLPDQPTFCTFMHQQVSPLFKLQCIFGVFQS